MQPRSQQFQRLFQLAAAHPLLEAAMAGLERRILLRQFAPLRTGAQHPQHAVQHRSRIMPRSATIIRSSCPTQYRLDDQPLFIGQLPASSHRLVRGITQSNYRMNQFRPSKVYETGSSHLLSSFLDAHNCTPFSQHNRDFHFDLLVSAHCTSGHLSLRRCFIPSIPGAPVVPFRDNLTSPRSAECAR